MAHKTLVYLILVTLIFGIYGYESSSTHFKELEFIQEPIQKNLTTIETIVLDGDNGPIELELLASYSIEAEVKSVEEYYDDYSSEISTRDFALAWGDINNPSIDRHVKYSQKDRWYYFTVSSRAPVPIDYVDYFSANTHIIPANEEVLDIVEDVQIDDTVTMEGYLVNVNFVDGYWHSSLTREDTGDGSCEILYVTSITINR